MIQDTVINLNEDPDPILVPYRDPRADPAPDLGQDPDPTTDPIWIRLCSFL